MHAEKAATTIQELQQKLQHSHTELAQVEQQLVDERQHQREKVAILEQAKTTLHEQFKALAQDVLQQSNKQFQQQQQNTLQQTLNPFRERLHEFEKKVSDLHTTEGKERASLQQHIKLLAEQHAHMSQETQALTQALTGQAKTRGDWGEMILERILEQAGLRKNQEYRVQTSHTAENGQRLQPDVIIDLPEDKHLIIDSKVNLIAWMALNEAESEQDILNARQRLNQALREHIRDLSGKNYQNLYQLQSLDFVLLFIPIEGAFSEIISHDMQLYNDALTANIVLVSPTTLLATMRTIAAIWRYDRQERNAFAIAELAGKMYDQLVHYSDSLFEVGKRIDQAQSAYDIAVKRLSEGRGNLIGRAEKVFKMGAQASKRLRKTIT